MDPHDFGKILWLKIVCLKIQDIKVNLHLDFHLLLLMYKGHLTQPPSGHLASLPESEPAAYKTLLFAYSFFCVC